MISSANRIYSEFVQTEAPRQVRRLMYLYYLQCIYQISIYLVCMDKMDNVRLGHFVCFQINIDCGTREHITKNISQPTLTSFDTAQKLIYSLMARDCYPRFLKSDIYQGLLRRGDSR